jgi:hypothetical protein
LTNRIANLKIDLAALLGINQGFDHNVNIERIVLGRTRRHKDDIADFEGDLERQSTT